MTQSKYDRLRRQVEIAERTRDAALIDTLVVSLKSRATGGKRYAALHKRVLDLNPAQPLKREDPAPWQRDKSSDMPVSIAKQVLRFEQEFRSAAAEIKVNSVSQNSNSVREKLRQEELKYTRKVRRVTGSSSPLKLYFEWHVARRGFAQSKWVDSIPTNQVWVFRAALSSKVVSKSVAGCRGRSGSTERSFQ